MKYLWVPLHWSNYSNYCGFKDLLLLLPALKSQKTGAISQRNLCLPKRNWQVAGLTHLGQEGGLNEDRFLIVEPEASLPCSLYAVADGVGGQQRSEAASQLTIDMIKAQFLSQPPATVTSFEAWLKAAIGVANHCVLTHQIDGTLNIAMSSTLIVALVSKGQVHIANVGNSRAYRLNQEGIEQIGRDHSLVERLIHLGQLTRRAAHTHPLKKVIYNNIGYKPEIEVSCYCVSLQPGARLLLCSDGLSDALTDETILTISHDHDNPAEVCQALVEAAKSAGSVDDITVIVVQME